MHITSIPSPNADTRDGHAVDMLVLHYTGMKDGARALARLTDAQAKVSAHYVVDELGGVFQLVDETQRAWHAGKASWRGHSNINQRSIGIEIVNPGHEFGYRPFPQRQMEALTRLCQAIILRYAIAARNVVGHSDVAPTRKQDPGELFDWRTLAAQGVGLWPLIAEGQKAGDAATTLAALAAYGYDISDEKAVITAFQRHFRPTDITGTGDAECAFLAQHLLAQCA